MTRGVSSNIKHRTTTLVIPISMTPSRQLMPILKLSLTVGMRQPEPAQAMFSWRGERAAHHADSAQQTEVRVDGEWIGAPRASADAGTGGHVLLTGRPCSAILAMSVLSRHDRYLGRALDTGNGQTQLAFP